MLSHVAAKLAAKQPVKLVSFGDSISEVGRTPGYYGGASCAAMNWVCQLKDLLANAYPDAEFTVEHFGIGGQNAFEGAGRLDWLGPFNADLVLVAFGANDCGFHYLPPEATAQALTGIIYYTQEVLHSDVILMGMGADNPMKPTMIHVDETLAATRGAAEERGVPYVDVRAAVLSATDNGRRWTDYHNGEQDCHPNDQGHGIWARAVFEVIMRELAESAVADASAR